ncbi:unnamed protein product [Closterium sp. NIES-53]
MHHMALYPSSVPQCVPLPSPPASSLADGPDHESDLARAASPNLTRLLATVLIDPSFEFVATSALVAELVDFAAACRLDYAASLVAESEQEDFECFAASVPYLVSMLIAPEGDPDAPDIPTPRSYVEAITGPYSSQWVKWSSGSPPAFKARYVARGFSQREGVYFFQTFSPTPKMTTLWVLLHIVAQRDYELHSLDLSTAVLQGSLHEEIWLRRPPGFTGTTLAALGFALSTAHPSLFLRTDSSLPLFYILVYVLQRFGFQYSSPQSPPLPTGHSLSAPPSDESVEPSGPYPELVGCLMYLMTCTRPDLAYPLSILARYVAPGRHRPKHWEAVKRVLHYLCSTSGMGLVLGGQGPVVLTVHADASWVDNLATPQLSLDYTFSLGSGSVSWRSTHSSSVLNSSCEAEIYVGAMAAQELSWLTYLLTDLGERPRSSPVLNVDNKAMIALCQEHRLEHRTKHIPLRYFLARDLQQRGQRRLAYVATRANTADIFTKALREETLATPGNLHAPFPPSHCRSRVTTRGTYVSERASRYSRLAFKLASHTQVRVTHTAVNRICSPSSAALSHVIPLSSSPALSLVTLANPRRPRLCLLPARPVLALASPSLALLLITYPSRARRPPFRASPFHPPVALPSARCPPFSSSPSLRHFPSQCPSPSLPVALAGMLAAAHVKACAVGQG